jgi:hypothetical protein
MEIAQWATKKLRAPLGERHATIDTENDDINALLNPPQEAKYNYKNNNNNGKSMFNPPELLPKCTTVGEIEVCLLYE